MTTFADWPAGRSEPAGIGWSLLAIAAALPFLVPPSGQPWPEFYREALLAAVWVGALGALWLGRRERWPLHGVGVFFAGLAVIAPLQAVIGLLTYPGESLWVGAYLVTLAALAAGTAALPPGRVLRVVDALAAGFVIASLASVGLAMAQWARWDGLGLLVHAGLPGGQPAANLGQPNLLATLLLWGLAGLWWALWRARIGAAVTVAAAAFMLLGVVLTQSRTGLIGALLMALAAALPPRVASLRTSRVVVLALAAGVVALAVAWPTLNAGIELSTARSLADVSSSGKRPLIWAHVIDAALHQPWLGYGWNQGTVAQAAVALEREPLGIVVQHAHSIVLDLALWNGIPLGLLIALAMLAWLVRRAWQARHDAPRRILLAALAVFALHALLELPHAVALFALPAAILVGAVESMAGATPRRTAPGWVAVVPFAAIACMLALAVLEYRALEANLMAHRLRQARIGNTAVPGEPSIWLLRPLQAALAAQRVVPRAGMAVQEIDEIERSARRYPAVGTLFRAAQARALNGRPDAAARWLDTLCRLHPRSVCTGLREAWLEMGASDQPAFLQVAGWGAR